jgi:hypothetical protein
MHGDAGRADRVSLGLEAAGRIDRQAAVHLCPALRGRAGALLFAQKANGLGFN